MKEGPRDMSKTTKTKDTAADAGAALEAYQDARTSLDVLRGARDAAKAASDAAGAGDTPTRLRALDAEIAFLRAEDALDAAAREADAVLHRVEVEAGKPDARALDVRTARDDIAKALEEADELRRQADAAEARAVQRWADAGAAHGRVRERRAAAGLPAPAPLPNVPWTPGKTPIRATPEALDKALAAGPPKGRREERIAQLQRDADALAVAYETRRRNEELREAEARAEAVRRRDDARRAGEAEAAERAKSEKAVRAALDAQRELARAARERLASGRV
jgi:hypothetical protein